MKRSFTITAQIDGINSNVGDAVAEDIRLELESRPYLHNSTAHWDSAHGAVVLTVDDVAESAEQAKAQIEDELTDIGYSVLDEIENIHIDIVNVVATLEK